MDLMNEIGKEGRVQRTQLSHKLAIGGVSKPYEVYRIRLDALRYNVQNDRIATWISQYSAEHGGALPDESDVEAYNEIIEEFIVKSNPEAIRKTTNNIKMFEQRVPAVVLNNGLIIDGNRRFTCLRALAKDESRFNWMEAVILPESVASDAKTIKLLELEIQHGEEGKIDYNPVERLVGIYNDIVKNKLLTVEEYAKGTNSKPGEVRKMVEQAGYMTDFLKFLNADEQFHLARELDIAGPLQEIQKIMKYCGSEDDQETMKSCVFANIAVEPAGDITRFIRKFKKILQSPYAAEFIEKEQDLAAEVADRLAEMPRVNKETLREGLRADQDLVDRFAEAVDVSEARANGVKILDTPLKKMEQALDFMEDVDTGILGRLSSTDMNRARNILLGIEECIAEIRGHLGEEMSGQGAENR